MLLTPSETIILIFVCGLALASGAWMWRSRRKGVGLASTRRESNRWSEIPNRRDGQPSIARGKPTPSLAERGITLRSPAEAGLLEAVQQLIDDFGEENPDDENWLAQLRTASRKANALPATLDWGGGCMLRHDGDFAAFVWEEDSLEIRPDECDDLGRLQRLASAALKFPQLAALLPPRFEAAETCPLCDGTGCSIGSQGEILRNAQTNWPIPCVCCCGLGWCP